MPQDVALLGGVKAIEGGEAHGCALKTDGSMYCWGNNAKGQLGIGSTANVNAPLQVANLGKSVRAISAGITHSCAALNTGVVWCWGANTSGQLGHNDGTSGWQSKLYTKPVVVQGSVPK